MPSKPNGRARPTRGGSVREITGGWQARTPTRLDVEGKRYAVPGGPFRTKTMALTHLEEYVRKVDSGEAFLPGREPAVLIPKRITINNFGERYVEQRRGSGLSPQTISSDEDNLKRIVHEDGGLSDVTLDALTRVEALKWLSWLGGGAYASVTAKHTLGLFKRILREAEAQDWEVNFKYENLVVNGRRGGSIRDKFVLTPPEVIAVGVAGRTVGQWGPAVEALFWTGLRGQELRALHGRHVFDDRLEVSEVLMEKPSLALKPRTKSGNSRYVRAIPRPILEWLNERAEEVGKDGLLFGAKKVPTDFQRNGDFGTHSWKPVMAAAGITPDVHHRDPGRRREVTAHDARAFFCSIMYALGSTEPEIIYEVGHSSGNITKEIYAMPVEHEPVINELRRQDRMRPSEKMTALYEALLADYETSPAASGTMDPDSTARSADFEVARAY